MAVRRLDRAAVLRAAAELADAEGLDNVTLARLAERLDRHVSSLYNHVDGLDGLRHDLAVIGAEGLAESITSAAVGRSGIDALQAIAHAYRNYVNAHPGCYFAMTFCRPGAPDDELARAGAPVTRAIYTVLGSIGLEDDQLAHAHRALTSAIRGFTIVELHRGFDKKPTADETFNIMVDVFCHSLVAGLWPAQDESRN